MYDHIGIHVKDIAASARFYEAALAPLGYGLCSRDDTSASFGPPDQPALYLNLAERAPGPGTHVALRAKHRRDVRRFHESGLAAGGRDNGTPGVRAAYGPDYYAAFLTDPDGNNVEAVCMTAEQQQS
jgi:catechol 2,3-dioxygenase-like lactoylglutathione lyase family enzyme